MSSPAECAWLIQRSRPAGRRVVDIDGFDRAEQFVRDIQREFLSLVEKRLAELAVRFDSVLPEVRARVDRNFKFSSERDDGDVIDMPSPLVRKTTIN